MNARPFHRNCWNHLAWALALSTLFLSAPTVSMARAKRPKIKKLLNAGAKDVLKKLGEFNHLPDVTWKVHAGDVAHGEAVNLDDSDWKPVGLESKSSSDAVWYRGRVAIPGNLNGYDLTGTRVWFKFKVSSSGPDPQIIYFNGRRVAMGEDMEPIVLFDKAKPGDHVLVAVKCLQTAGEKTFHGADMKIDFSEKRPNPEDLREEIEAASSLIPVLSTDQDSDKKILDDAVDSIDLSALEEAHDQERFDRSLEQANARLKKLEPLLHEATFHETGNSHIDAAWLWPRSETIDVVKRTFSTALQLMNEYPWYTYTQSAAAYNEWLAEKYPDINNEIKKRIKEGRWEVVGGMWVEPDLNLPSGESIQRSILIGKRWFQENYGVDVHIGWNPDSFGYNWQLPQIYKKSGIDYFVTQKMSWNDTNQLPFKLFWWESPDGSKVLTYFPRGYANRSMSPTRMSRDFAEARKQSPGLEEMMDLYGVGDHGGGPTRAMLDEAAHWMSPGKIVPKYQFGTAKSFFNDVENKIVGKSPVWNYDSIARGYKPPDAPEKGKIAIPTWDTELYLEYHRGVYTTQANHKRNLREGGEWLLNAEKLASLAWLNGVPYPGARLTDCWKKTTFNDFHDLAAGSGIGVIYKDAQRDFDKVHLEANDISDHSMKSILSQINTSAAGATPVLVWNPLAWERTGAVETDIQMPGPASSGISIMDPDNKVLVSTVLSSDTKTNTFHVRIPNVRVPSMGYTVLKVMPGTRPAQSDLKADGLTLENDKIRVTVDSKTGCITSLFNKADQFEAIKAGGLGNELQTYKDTPSQYDAWNIDPGTYDVPPTNITEVDSVELVESNPVRATIRVKRHWQNSTFVQDIQLAAGSEQVNVVNDIDWHETHVLLKVAFPLAASSDKATYEIPFGTIQRSTKRDNSWEKAQFEVPAQRWADLGDGQHGFSLINESKFGYDCRDNVLRLTLLRSPVWPDPEADRGHHHFSYALYPHAGDWKQAFSVRHGFEYNYRLTAQQVRSHAGSLPLSHSFLNVGADNLVLTAMKKAEDTRGLILHMYEWAGKSGDAVLTLPEGARSVTMTNLMEQPEGNKIKVENGKVTIPVHPYEILALRVDFPAR